MSQDADDDRSLEAETLLEEALAKYFAERHALVDAFVDRHFTFRGSLDLHRRAFGLDLLRVPVNLCLTVPTAALKASAALARRAGAMRSARWLDTRDLFLRTAVSRRIEDRIRTELLGMPAEGTACLDDPPFAAMLADQRASRRRAEASDSPDEGAVPGVGLSEVFATYGGTRTAAGEVSSAFLSLGVGAMAFGKLTPGVMTLGPSLAIVLAHQAAVASFPLGATLGGFWYGLFPAAVSTNLLVGVVAALMLASASLAAFAGVLADPVQRRLGIHQRRLHRMLDVLEANLRGPDRKSLAVKDHYVARMLDLLDYVAAAARIMRTG